MTMFVGATFPVLHATTCEPRPATCWTDMADAYKLQSFAHSRYMYLAIMVSDFMSQILAAIYIGILNPQPGPQKT